MKEEDEERENIVLNIIKWHIINKLLHFAVEEIKYTFL